MKKIIIVRLKIFASLLIALLVVSYGAPNVFVAGSSQVREEFIAGVKLFPQTVMAYVQYPTDSKSRIDKVETEGMPSQSGKETLEYTPVSNGISASEDPITNQRIIKIGKGTTLEKRFIMIDGKEIAVYAAVND